MRAVLFVHFDRDGIFDPHVLYSLKAYRKLADHLVVVSPSADRLPAGYQDLADTFIHRENKGYDFCSWKAGLESIVELHRYDELVFVNDSVYGPLFDLEQVLSSQSIENADMRGMVLSEQTLDRSSSADRTPHIQSWFFSFTKNVIQSEAFHLFWAGVTPLDSKTEIIQRYEIGMSRYFENAGFQIAGVYDARQHGRIRWKEIGPELSIIAPGRSYRLLRKSLRATYNPSELAWERLLKAGVPYLKVNLFRNNHYGLNTDRVLKNLNQYTDYDVSMITSHLSRVMR